MIDFQAVRWEADVPTLGAVAIQQYLQRNDSIKYAVEYCGSRVLNKNLEWELQPGPSYRDEKFLDRCRYNSYEEAQDMLDKYLKK